MRDDTLLVAGHVLTAPVEAPAWLTGVPATIVTISGCIMTTLPRPQFRDWWVEREDAELVRARMAPEADVTTVAFDRDRASLLMDETGGSDEPFFAGLRRAEPFGGGVLGYEVVGADDTLDFHSWHCHSYAAEVRDELGIVVNDLGLLSTRADADAVLAWMLRQPPDNAPEQGVWLVAALGSTPS